MSSTLGYSTLENNENDDSADQQNFLNERREARNSTRKRRESFITKPNQNKLNPAILEQMHSMSNDDEEDGVFPPKPQSAGVEKTKEQEEKKQQTSESMVNMNNDKMFRTLGRPPQPTYDVENNLDLNDYSNYGDEKKNDEYYKRMLPGYPQQRASEKNTTNKPYYSQVNYQIPETTDSVLLQKMNYMITLLEDQQDERTNNVTEEVILYSFLGVFIIFIADTFVRAGKYVR
jgi:hypothetical protein